MSGKFGWCTSCQPNKPSTYHDLCRTQITSTFGVTSHCTCEHHEED